MRATEGNQMAYSEKVIDHYEHPRNVGSFAKDEEGVDLNSVQWAAH